MQNFFSNWYCKWRALLSERAFMLSFFSGLALLLLAYFINYYASSYTQKVQVLSVGDLILDNIPTVDLSMIYTFGIYLTEAIFVIYPIFFRPDLLPFTAKTIAAFYLIRAGFITLTHLGAPADYFALPQFTDQPGLSRFFFLNDLFFSGHTGFPFLGALLFWTNKPLRIFLIAMSVAQAITVLFMHIHYSIDVFSAYFIVYTIYVISDKVLRPLNLAFKKIAQNGKNLSH